MRPPVAPGLAISLAFALASGLAACSPARPYAALTLERDAATWRPLVLSAPAAVRAGRPAALDVVAKEALLAWQARRDESDKRAIAYWAPQGGALRWAEIARQAIADEALDAHRAARALGLVYGAIADAALASWETKAYWQQGDPAQEVAGLKPLSAAEGGPLPGVPSYPSEHAAIAYAAAGMLETLFPERKDEWRQRAIGAAETRLAAGACAPPDRQAGQAIGQAVVNALAVWGTSPGQPGRLPDSALMAEAPLMPVAIGKWYHPAPLAPLAGRWRTYFLTSGAELRPPEPPMPGTPAFEAQVIQLHRITDKLPADKLAIALKWDVEPPALQWADVSRSLLAKATFSTPRTAALLGYTQAAIADANVACQDARYTHLRPGPQMADPGLTPALTLPATPSFPSDHAVVASAAAAYMAAAFPAQAERLQAMALEAGQSRVYGGVAFQDDVTVGHQLGAAVAARALTARPVPISPTSRDAVR